MSFGPIQTFLFGLCLFLATSLFGALLYRSALSYVRWTIIVGICAFVTLDVLNYLIVSGHDAPFWAGLYMAVELSGAVAWFLFSRRYARTRLISHTTSWYWFVCFALIAVMGVVAALTGIFVLPRSSATQAFLVLTIIGFAVRVITLVILIMSLVSLEATLVNSVHGQRWRIKFAILGAFSILAAQGFTLSLGLLYRTLDLSLAPARQTGFVIGVTFLLYSALFRGGEPPVMVSKRLARTSLVMFGAGTYLLFLGALGLAMSLTGGSGNRSLLLALGLVVGVGLLTLLLSDQFRRRCQRLLQQYFYKEKYDYRIQWLAFTKRLANARSRDDLYQAVLLGFCETFGMGGAVLYLKGADGSKHIPVLTWEIKQDCPVLSTEDPLPNRLRSSFIPVDLHTLPRSALNTHESFLTASEARFAVPLHCEDELDGFILLTRPVDKTEEYTQEDFDLMEALANQGYSSLRNLRLSDLLSQARDMEILGKVSAFIVHDLKNLVYPLSLMVKNAQRYIHEPEFQKDMLKSLENTVAKMHVLISQLRMLPTQENLTLEDADLSQVVRDAFANNPIQDAVFTGGRVWARVDRSQFQKVVLNLVLNAREASPEGAPVTVEIGRDTTPYFRVADKGSGMSSQFVRESLFQPFRTTKPMGMGIGLYQCKQIVEAHGGIIEVASSQGEGSVFTVRLPEPDLAAVQEGA